MNAQIGDVVNISANGSPRSAAETTSALKLQIAEAMNVRAGELSEITAMKKGMTNCSFSFLCRGEKFIIRIPGAGTDHLIDRAQEAAAYRAIDGKGICDDMVYFDPESGCKITRFLEGARVCDPLCEADTTRCMQKLRAFHDLALTVPHTFDLFGKIAFYESLRGGRASVYPDYAETKEQVFGLRAYIDAQPKRCILAHIDAVADNFLFVPDSGRGEDIRLIDWEYAGMQDPHVDIAMFCLYSMYDRVHIDRLIDLYFTEGCAPSVRLKIYCYIAAGGLLWSNWCEYKKSLGVDFGDYALYQYHCAKTFARIVNSRLGT